MGLRVERTTEEGTFGWPLEEDYSIWWSMLGSLHLWNLPYNRSNSPLKQKIPSPTSAEPFHNHSSDNICINHNNNSNRNRNSTSTSNSTSTTNSNSNSTSNKNQNKSVNPLKVAGSWWRLPVAATAARSSLGVRVGGGGGWL